MSIRLIYTHAGAMAVTLIDGLILNRTVPVRLNHLWINMFLGTLYMGWSIFQGLVIGTNPDLDDGHGPIYPIVNWRTNLGTCLVFSFGILLVVIPFSTFVLWFLSLHGRKYIQEEAKVAEEEMEEEEVGTDIA